MTQSRIKILQDRSHLLQKARSFFYERNVLEVDCPLLTQGASVDLHIDLISALYQASETRYLHSSPEYGMKRLLVEGIGDIYQISHVFRDGESGIKHNPEFMMAEWYRHGFTFEQMIAETMEFIQIFLGKLPIALISYREAFKRYAELDYLTATTAELLHYIYQNDLPIYSGIETEGKDALLNLILGIVIEPHLGTEELCALIYYPSSQAALARSLEIGEEKVAERFEVYFNGMELANGYHELTDPVEQRKRFIDANQQRIGLGKQELPIDEYFLKALHKGLPDCSGVAVGVDRLMMLRHKASHIKDVIPFVWQEA